MTGTLQQTILRPIHDRLNAKFGPFAGYEMPLTYEAGGAIAEHVHTRQSASLFDVSHMGVVDLHGPELDDIALALETVVPGGITTLKPGRSRYTFFTNDAGGILDDLIMTRLEDRFTAVVNASRKEHDIALLSALAGSVPGLVVEARPDLHLIAVQGPLAARAIASAGIIADELTFMQTAIQTVDGHDVRVSRSGYTGEDGFEVALPAEIAVAVTEQLLADDAVEAAGLVARDSLRLEAGLHLYGNDLDETTTPVEAGLLWAIPKRRREAGGYPGAAIIADQMANGTSRVRVGIVTDQRRPIRPGNELKVDGSVVGRVTSGGFGPTIDGPVAMAFVAPAFAAVGTALVADVRGNEIPCAVADLPFVPHNYRR